MLATLGFNGLGCDSPRSEEKELPPRGKISLTLDCPDSTAAADFFHCKVILHNMSTRGVFLDRRLVWQPRGRPEHRTIELRIRNGSAVMEESSVFIHGPFVEPDFDWLQPGEEIRADVVVDVKVWRLARGTYNLQAIYVPTPLPGTRSNDSEEILTHSITSNEVTTLIK